MQDTILVLIKFNVRGNLRFLSHAEMVRVFQRACARAGIEVVHSQGFNPRPKLSLPLPRSVGTETDDDLLTFRIGSPGACESRIKAKLSKQLPNGCELLSVSLSETKTPLQPCAATYILPVQQQYIDEQLKTSIKQLLASENLNLKRQMDARGITSKNVDVRGFLGSIEIQDTKVVVECKITSAGSIRIDEILQLLDLDLEKLAGPIRRTNVKWHLWRNQHN